MRFRAVFVRGHDIGKLANQIQRLNALFRFVHGVGSLIQFIELSYLGEKEHEIACRNSGEDFQVTLCAKLRLDIE